MHQDTGNIVFNVSRWRNRGTTACTVVTLCW
jgi:hypothetical protein